MINRQRLILELLAISGGPVDLLRLVKSVFLLRHDLGFEDRFYDFVPYRFGPFSFVLYHELSKLESKGIVKTQGDRLRLTPHGQRVRPRPMPGHAKAIRALVKELGTRSTDELIASIYKRYPWYTVNARDRRRRRMLRPTAAPAVYTVGYEGLPVDGLLNLLLRNGIQTLIDTRHNPISRRYGFHRSTLSRLCENLGLRYEHFPKLGIPGEWRRDLRIEELPRLFERYENEVLAKASRQLGSLEELMASSASVLLCSERLPEHCHRHRLAAKMASRLQMPMLDLRLQGQPELTIDA